MALTYQCIGSNTLGSSTASVTFSSIPGTFTDLELRLSMRSDVASTNGYAIFTFNGNTSNYTELRAEWDGTTAGAYRRTSTTDIQLLAINGASSTSNTFSSHSIFIPSYTVSQSKPLSLMFNREQNAVGGYLGTLSGFWANSAAITSITISTTSGNFVAGSSFFLYGIKNS